MAPLINDVATDLEDPPVFSKTPIDPLPESFKPIIQQHYADLKPKEFTSKGKEEVYASVLRLAKERPRWTVTYEDRQSGIVEGMAVTFLLRFRDDFVIRVREKGQGGSVVDMRSRSRLGKGDLGANAQRIREFFAALDADATPSS